MSQTSIQPTTREWIRGIVTRTPHQIIGGADDPYLLRWHIIPRNPLLNVYLHKFLRSDDDRALHDHPWWFLSLILRGRYDEVTAAGTKRRRAGSIAFRPAQWRHRVQLLPYLKQCGGPVLKPEPQKAPWVRFWRNAEQPCWTLIITGRRVRTWGFWCPALPMTTANMGSERFIRWNEFGDAGCGEPQ